jgi:hypothetical protein
MRDLWECVRSPGKKRAGRARGMERSDQDHRSGADTLTLNLRDGPRTVERRKNPPGTMRTIA